MGTFVIVFLFCLAAIAAMGLSLYFSKYKRKKTCGCGAALENSGKETPHSASCPACSSEEFETRKK
jgi:hypothetical protein